MPNYKYQCTECFKTYIGPQLSGTMTCNCNKPKQITGVRLQTPLSDELTEVVDVTASAKLRANLCHRWNIVNKSHAKHGSNFSGNQRVVDLIHDIVAPVLGQLRTSVRQMVIVDFSYDIDTCEMVG